MAMVVLIVSLSWLRYRVISALVDLSCLSSGGPLPSIRRRGCIFHTFRVDKNIDSKNRLEHSTPLSSSLDFVEIDPAARHSFNRIEPTAIAHIIWRAVSLGSSPIELHWAFHFSLSIIGFSILKIRW
jgi:hypothetical protein